jgi:hypothetical protein
MRGAIEAFEADMMVMLVGEMPMMEMPIVEMPVEVMVVGRMGMMTVVGDHPCHAQHLEDLDQRGRQEEGQDERVQQAEILAHEPAALLENCWRTPYCQAIWIPFHHLDRLPISKLSAT